MVPLCGVVFRWIPALIIAGAVFLTDRVMGMIWIQKQVTGFVWLVGILTFLIIVLICLCYLKQKDGIILMAEAGCASLSRPTGSGRGRLAALATFAEGNPQN